MRSSSRSPVTGGISFKDRSRRRRHPVAALIAAITMVVLAMVGDATTVAAQTRSPQIAIVVHPAAPVDNLSFAEMRKVFRGERQYWTPNVAIVLLMRAPVALERDVILKRVYAMSEAQFKQFWIAKIFRDEAATVPKILYSNEQISDLVSSIPGSIGFMDAAAVPAGLKVLKIDGQLPGQPGYPLQ